MSIEAPVASTADAAQRPPEAEQQVERRRTALWVVYGVLSVLLLAYVLSEIFRPAGQTWPWLDNWAVAGFEFVGAGLCIARGFVGPRKNVVPITLGLGLMAWSLGDVAIAIESAGGATPPSPSVADGFYLVFYLLTYVALMMLVRRDVRRLNMATWLDGAVAGLGAAALCAAFAFPQLLRAHGGDTASVAVNLAYPVGDLVLLAMVFACTTVLPGRKKAPWLLMAVAYTMNTLGDTSNLFTSGFGATQVGTALNAVAWPISILLVSFAVWIKTGRSAAVADEEPPGFVLPALAAIAALVILFEASVRHRSRVGVALALATLVVAGVRAALSLISLREITEERHRQAITDLLTGLGNRRELFHHLDRLCPREPDPEDVPRRVAFLYVDLNGFKEVNDSFGHQAGDELLRQLGARMRGSLRNSDLLVRLGGDEFGVTVADADAEAAATVAQRLSARLEEPFVLEAVRARISASIGIALVPDNATDAHDLLRCADVAMYRAKQSGKSFAIYQEDLDGNGNRMRLVEELESAIMDKEFELHYQPQVDLTTGKIVSVEALLRWPHPRLGFVPPLEFLPLAEEAGLMQALTALVLDDAIAQCVKWRARGHEIYVSVNISASSLVDREFPAFVAERLKRHKLPPKALVLEITETTAIADLERAKHAIEELQEREVVVSVDDFGAGFTSLSYLSSLAVSELKLDRSFISGLATQDGGRDLALVRSTIALAHSLGLRVVAEGVEDNASLDLLTDLGCDLAQGYLISKPKPPHELALAKRLGLTQTSSPAPKPNPLLGGGTRPAPAAGTA